MYKNIITTFALLCVIFVITSNAEENCSTICAATSCRPVGSCDKPNEEVRISPQDRCKCCPYCVTILSEGEKCTDLPLVDGFPAIVECSKKAKLICKNGICQKRVL